MKKKYKEMKKDEHVYEDMISEFDRQQLSDYDFKTKGQALGKNYRKLKRDRIISIILTVIVSVIVVYIGYFIIEVIKNLNSRDMSRADTQSTTSQVYTTYPENTDSTEKSTYSEVSDSSESGTVQNSKGDSYQ